MTFDEYRNHLNILYILGEDYLLETTMHSNIQSCDITYSDIDNNDNKVLRNMYKNNYCCNYEKYIRLINADDHIKIENFNNIDSNEESEEEEKNKKENKNEVKNGDKNEDNKNGDKNEDNENEDNENEYIKNYKNNRILILIIIKRNQKANILEY